MRASSCRGHISERLPALVDGSRVRDTPMRCDCIARPCRADLPRRLIANREDKIHDRRARSCELVPALAAQPICVQMQAVEQIKSERMNTTTRKAAGAETLKPPLTPMLDQHFGQNAFGRVARAQEQDIVGLVRHGFRTSTVADTT